MAQQLGVPEHLLQVLSWGQSSVVITYWMVRDLLPLAELALCREDVRAELTRHGVEEVYLGSHPSDHPSPVSSRGVVVVLDCAVYIPWLPFPYHCRWTNLCGLYIVREKE